MDERVIVEVRMVGEKKMQKLRFDNLELFQEWYDENEENIAEMKE